MKTKMRGFQKREVLASWRGRTVEMAGGSWANITL